MDDKGTHTIHRLEAFTDIVIGFCLAQLGLNLFLPKSAADVVSVWASMTILISAFFAIALLWWFYHRVVSNYFVLYPPMVVLNFGMLCGVILSTYLFESIVHVSVMGQDPRRFVTLLVISFAVVYELLGAMLYIGIRRRSSTLQEPERRWAMAELANIAMAVPVATGTIALLTHSGWAVYVAIAMAAAVLTMRRFVTSRWKRASNVPFDSSGSFDTSG